MAATQLWLLAVLGAGVAFLGYVAHRLRLPPALGYLAVGMAFAPTVRATPDLPLDIFKQASQVGVLFLLFAIGLDLDLRRLREILQKTALTLPFDLLVPALAAAGFARLLGWSLQEAVTLGIVVSLSSTLFGERLAATPSFAGEARQRVLGVLLAEDVAAAGLLALLAVLGGDGGAGWIAPALDVGRLLFLFILLTAAGLLVVPRLLDAVARTHAHELVVLTAGGVVVAFGAAGTWAGSAELGALVAGVAAAEAGSRFVVRNGIGTLRDVALAVFFVTTGLTVDSLEAARHPGLVFGLAGLFLASKLFVHVPAALGAGLAPGAALRTALGLGTLGEFSLILAAAAADQGIAHPLLSTAVVGAMLVLLVASALLLNAVPVLVRGIERLPARIRRPATWLVQSVRRSHPTATHDPQKRRHAVRRLVSNLMLLAVWGIGASYLVPRLAAIVPGGPIVAPSLAFGAAFAVAIPLLVSTYRSYRDLVRILVGIRPGEREGAAKVRARLVDAWVAGTAFLLLLPVALIVPTTLPVLVAGLLLAVIIATLAWRQLSRFHDALEGTVVRVLGEDAETGKFLDRLLEKYPWGVRFAAVAVPPGSPAAGRTLQNARIAELTGATVAVVQRRSREVVNPGPEHVVLAGDTMVLMGDAHQIARAEALIVAHGEVLRLTVQSRLAGIVEDTVPPDSPLIGRTLGEVDLRGRTGTLVVGQWPKGAPHPIPYRSDLVVQAEDHLILLGAPLQVERAKKLIRPSAPAAPPG